MNPLTISSQITQPTLAAPASDEFLPPRAAYVHIPFCRRRCYYCDFPITVMGDRLRGDNSGTISHYVEILCQEIAATPVVGAPLETVFFGGGTPSLLSVKQLQQILSALDQRFGIATTAEISIEMDPGTFDFAQIQGFRDLGVNRVSLGVQAFQPELLTACGRSHTVSDVYTAVDLLHQVEVPSFSLDLISGLPQQTLSHWQAGLAAAVAIAPHHISVYDLTIEPGTAFGRQYQPGEHPLPTDITTTQMYRLTQQVLTAAGYEHYEISNYAQPSHQCRHNRVYWENRAYYGFGMGAASYVNGQRFTRPRKTREYFAWVADFQNQGKIDCPITPLPERFLDTLMLGLRLAEGIDLKQLTAQFGADCLSPLWYCLQPYYQQGWVEVLAPDWQPCADTLPLQGQIKLSDPEGFLFSNVVLVKLFEQFGV